MRIALVFLSKNEFRYPPLGLLRIGGYLKEKAKDFKVKIIDMTFEDVYEEIDKFKPDIIGISTYITQYQDNINFARRIKKKYPDVKIIAGGPHITTLPESLDENFDYGILGPGEKRFFKLIEAISKNQSAKKIDGIVYREQGKLIINKRKIQYEFDLEESYLMDYNLLNKKYWKKKYVPEICDFKVSTGVITSIGCPFDCIFCSAKACWGNIRYRKIDLVVEEIKYLHDNFGVTHIDLADDLFSINKARLNEFYEKLKKENLINKITYTCQARADILDDEICQLFNKLNVIGATFGFESGSDRILKYVKNTNTSSIEKNKKAILLCKKYKINVSGSLMMGIPTEKISDMKKTLEFLDFAKKNKAIKIWAQILVPLPATKTWEIAKQRGKIKDKLNWKSINIYNKYEPLLLDKDVSFKEFLKLYLIAKKKCRFFVYRLVLKTLSNNPKSFFYFLREGCYYIKRLMTFVKQ